MTGADRSAIRDAVENLLYEYADGADRSDPQAVARTLRAARFAAPAGDEVTGESAILEYAAKLFAAGTQSTHLLANIRLSVGSGAVSATTIANYQKWVISDEPRLDSTGRYVSSFALGEGGWEFREHRVETRWRRLRQPESP